MRLILPKSELHSLKSNKLFAIEFCCIAALAFNSKDDFQNTVTRQLDSYDDVRQVSPEQEAAGMQFVCYQ